MVTMLYGFGRINGSWLMLVLYLVSYVLYLGCCFLFRYNRGRIARRRILLTPLVLTELADPVLFLILFPGGQYYNYGIGGAWAVILLWPTAAILTGAIVTALNRDDFAD